MQWHNNGRSLGTLSPEIFTYLEKIEFENDFINYKIFKGLAKKCIGEEWLNGSVLLNIHREIDITAEKVINKFAENHRKLHL